MTTRVLPRDEWPRLAGTEAETVWPYLDPARTSIVVVERDGVIVGCHVLSFLLHAECLWKAAGTGAGVSRCLWTAVQREARERWDVQAVVTGAEDDRVRQLLTHVDARSLGEQFVIPLGE